MRTATELQHDVLDELEFEPSLRAEGIGVAVTDGVVTLYGHVGSYAERLTAERTARRVAGVHAVANDLAVELWPGSARDDTAIARAALHALEWNTLLPRDTVQVTVRDGWVTLEGTLDWQYQKETARHVVAELTGVRGVTNRVTLRPRVHPRQVERHVQSAFQRSASLDARGVRVETVGSRVVLRGTVRSAAEAEDAERAAWCVPGVLHVDNELVVEAPELLAL